jgi:hypothetical protein
MKMAKIELNAFVSDWKFGEKVPNPSWGMKVSEPHSKKEGEKWVKVGSTNYTVKSAYGVDIDFSKFGQGERVAIVGTLTSESWESNGNKGKSLVIKATSVELLQSGQHEHRNVGTRDPFTDADAPF